MKVVMKWIFCILLGFFVNYLFVQLKTDYFIEFLRSNLTLIAITLLAINTATLSIVLTKIRDMLDKTPVKSAFQKTRKEIQVSIIEQIVIILLSIILFALKDSQVIKNSEIIITIFDVIIISSFFYLIYILYDTAKSVFIILDL